MTTTASTPAQVNRRRHGAPAWIIALFTALALALAGCSAPADGEPGAPGQLDAISVAGAGPTSTWYQYGAAICQQVTTELGAACTPTPSTGVVENIRTVGEGSVTMAFGHPNVLADAAAGKGQFSAPVTNLRSLVATYPFALHVVTLKKSGITTLEGLRGKRLGAGPGGSVDIEYFQAILDAAGIPLADLQTRQFDLSARVGALRDGNVDAIVALGGAQAASIQELAATAEISYIPIPADILAKVNAAQPAFTAGTIPAGTYKGVDADVPALFGFGVLFAREDLPEQAAYDITRLVLEKHDAIAEAVPAAKETTKETAGNVPIDLHPGAARYLKEIGAVS